MSTSSIGMQAQMPKKLRHFGDAAMKNVALDLTPTSRLLTEKTNGSVRQ